MRTGYEYVSPRSLRSRQPKGLSTESSRLGRRRPPLYGRGYDAYPTEWSPIRDNKGGTTEAILRFRPCWAKAFFCVQGQTKRRRHDHLALPNRRLHAKIRRESRCSPRCSTGIGSYSVLSGRWRPRTRCMNDPMGRPQIPSD